MPAMNDFLGSWGGGTLAQAARRVTRSYARTFYFASFVLPREKREAAYVIYALCRRADNILDDGALSTPEKLKGLDRLRQGFAKLYAGSGNLSPKEAALRDCLIRYDIPRNLFDELLDGVAMDLTVSRYRAWSDLERYCYGVASTVGLIMARVFGASRPEAYPHAIAMGKAMQLTNILRDIKEDWGLGRIYLPAEDMQRFGYDEEALGRGLLNDNFRNLMRFEIERARGLYALAIPGLRFLAEDGSRYCARLMSGLYAHILDVIERHGYDVFTARPVVPFLEKLGYAIHESFA
jgi:phytoene synthase